MFVNLPYSVESISSAIDLVHIVELALNLERNAKVINRSERVLHMVANLRLLKTLESAAQVRLGEVELALILKQQAKVVDRMERVAMISP